jgi:bacillithiol system protein YtxJ
MINWKIIDSPDILNDAINESFRKDIIIFKHSTTCSISHVAKLRLEENWDLNENISPYFLDLKTYRIISDDIAERLNVHHESPQILLIRNGDVIYDASHFDISKEELKESLAWHVR